jgi:Skp family chaperone for outer membrane proteins
MIKILLALIAFLPFEHTHVDSTMVRYGNLATVKWESKPTVGIIRSKAVYRVMSEYQTILKEDIKKGSARYTQLMQKCTDKYKTAVRTVASPKYALIVEQGGVSDYPTTDVTDLVIKTLK